jgi:DNA-binding response OmpR family regulator
MTCVSSPVTVLLVEDDPAHAEITERNLEPFLDEGKVVWARDGQEAIRHLSESGARSPDLMVVDLHMPRINGLDLLRLVRANEHWKRIPVVILTTSEAETDVAAAYELGASGYLVKPADFTQLLTAMEAFGNYWLKWNRFPPRSPRK